MGKLRRLRSLSLASPTNTFQDAHSEYTYMGDGAVMDLSWNKQNCKAEKAEHGEGSVSASSSTPATSLPRISVALTDKHLVILEPRGLT